MTEPSEDPCFIVDTSVALKWFLEKDEANVGRARELREAFIAGLCTLRAPSLLLVEIANALTVGRRSSRALIARALRDIAEIKLDLAELHFSTLDVSVELALRFGITVYDSYFLALAIESGGMLVTADEAFLKRVGRHPAVVSLASLQLH